MSHPNKHFSFRTHNDQSHVHDSRSSKITSHERKKTSEAQARLSSDLSARESSTSRCPETHHHSLLTKLPAPELLDEEYGMEHSREPVSRKNIKLHLIPNHKRDDNSKLNSLPDENQNPSSKTFGKPKIIDDRIIDERTPVIYKTVYSRNTPRAATKFERKKSLEEIAKKPNEIQKSKHEKEKQSRLISENENKTPGSIKRKQDDNNSKVSLDVQFFDEFGKRREVANEMREKKLKRRKTEDERIFLSDCFRSFKKSATSIEKKNCDRIKEKSSRRHSSAESGQSSRSTSISSETSRRTSDSWGEKYKCREKDHRSNAIKRSSRINSSSSEMETCIKKYKNNDRREDDQIGDKENFGSRVKNQDSLVDSEILKTSRLNETPGFQRQFEKCVTNVERLVEESKRKSFEKDRESPIDHSSTSNTKSFSNEDSSLRKKENFKKEHDSSNRNLCFSEKEDTKKKTISYSKHENFRQENSSFSKENVRKKVSSREENFHEKDKSKSTHHREVDESVHLHTKDSDFLKPKTVSSPHSKEVTEFSSSMKQHSQKNVSSSSTKDDRKRKNSSSTKDVSKKKQILSNTKKDHQKKDIPSLKSPDNSTPSLPSMPNLDDLEAFNSISEAVISRYHSTIQNTIPESPTKTIPNIRLRLVKDRSENVATKQSANAKDDYARWYPVLGDTSPICPPEVPTLNEKVDILADIRAIAEMEGITIEGSTPETVETSNEDLTKELVQSMDDSSNSADSCALHIISDDDLSVEDDSSNASDCLQIVAEIDHQKPKDSLVQLNTHPENQTPKRSMSDIVHLDSQPKEQAPAISKSIAVLSDTEREEHAPETSTINTDSKKTDSQTNPKHLDTNQNEIHLHKTITDAIKLAIQQKEVEFQQKIQAAVALAIQQRGQADNKILDVQDTVNEEEKSAKTVKGGPDETKQNEPEKDTNEKEISQEVENQTVSKNVEVSPDVQSTPVVQPFRVLHPSELGSRWCPTPVQTQAAPEPLAPSDHIRNEHSPSNKEKSQEFPHQVLRETNFIQNIIDMVNPSTTNQYYQQHHQQMDTRSQEQINAIQTGQVYNPAINHPMTNNSGHNPLENTSTMNNPRINNSVSNKQTINSTMMTNRPINNTFVNNPTMSHSLLHSVLTNNKTIDHPATHEQSPINNNTIHNQIPISPVMSNSPNLLSTNIASQETSPGQRVHQILSTSSPPATGSRNDLGISLSNSNEIPTPSNAQHPRQVASATISTTVQDNLAGMNSSRIPFSNRIGNPTQWVPQYLKSGFMSAAPTSMRPPTSCDQCVTNPLSIPPPPPYPAYLLNQGHLPQSAISSSLTNRTTGNFHSNMSGIPAQYVGKYSQQGSQSRPIVPMYSTPNNIGMSNARGHLGQAQNYTPAYTPQASQAYSLMTSTMQSSQVSAINSTMGLLNMSNSSQYYGQHQYPSYSPTRSPISSVSSIPVSSQNTRTSPQQCQLPSNISATQSQSLAQPVNPQTTPADFAIPVEVAKKTRRSRTSHESVVGLNTSTDFLMLPYEQFMRMLKHSLLHPSIPYLYDQKTPATYRNVFNRYKNCLDHAYNRLIYLRFCRDQIVSGPNSGLQMVKLKTQANKFAEDLLLDIDWLRAKLGAPRFMASIFIHLMIAYKKWMKDKLHRDFNYGDLFTCLLPWLEDIDKEVFFMKPCVSTKNSRPLVTEINPDVQLGGPFRPVPFSDKPNFTEEQFERYQAQVKWWNDRKGLMVMNHCIKNRIEMEVNRRMSMFLKTAGLANKMEAREQNKNITKPVDELPAVPEAPMPLEKDSTAESVVVSTTSTSDPEICKERCGKSKETETAGFGSTASQRVSAESREEPNEMETAPSGCTASQQVSTERRDETVETEKAPSRLATSNEIQKNEESSNRETERSKGSRYSVAVEDCSSDEEDVPNNLCTSTVDFSILMGRSKETEIAPCTSTVDFSILMGKSKETETAPSGSMASEQGSMKNHKECNETETASSTFAMNNNIPEIEESSNYEIERKLVLKNSISVTNCLSYNESVSNRVSIPSNDFSTSKVVPNETEMPSQLVCTQSKKKTMKAETAPSTLAVSNDIQEIEELSNCEVSRYPMIIDDRFCDKVNIPSDLCTRASDFSTLIQPKVTEPAPSVGAASEQVATKSQEDSEKIETATSTLAASEDMRKIGYSNSKIERSKGFKYPVTVTDCFSDEENMPNNLHTQVNDFSIIEVSSITDDTYNNMPEIMITGEIRVKGVTEAMAIGEELEVVKKQMNTDKTEIADRSQPLAKLENPEMAQEGNEETQVEDTLNVEVTEVAVQERRKEKTVAAEHQIVEIEDSVEFKYELPQKFGTCLRCGKASSIACARCFSAAYCSNECSDTYWAAVHHKTCKPVPIDFFAEL